MGFGAGLARKRWAYCSRDPSCGEHRDGQGQARRRQLECLCSVNEVGLVGEFLNWGDR